MSELFFKRSLRIHEDIGLTKLHECYRIVDPTDGHEIATATEEADLWACAQKLFLDKSLVPMTIRLADARGATLLTLKQSRSILRTKITAYHSDGRVLGIFQETLCPVHPRINVTDAQGQSLGHLIGDWRKRRFSYHDAGGVEVGRVEHLYTGLARALFTTADDYHIDVLGDLSWNPLLIAGTLAIDVMFHEA